LVGIAQLVSSDNHWWSLFAFAHATISSVHTSRDYANNFVGNSSGLGDEKGELP
jgi:hypothetical protein